MLNHICANVCSATWCFAWQTFACCVSEFVTLTAVQTNMLSYVIDQKFIYDLHMCIHFFYMYKARDKNGFLYSVQFVYQ